MNDYVTLIKKYKKLYIITAIISIVYFIILAVVYAKNVKGFNEAIKKFAEATNCGAKNLISFPVNNNEEDYLDDDFEDDMDFIDLDLKDGHDVL
jgi:hypothetical protein